MAYRGGGRGGGRGGDRGDQRPPYGHGGAGGSGGGGGGRPFIWPPPPSTPRPVMPAPPPGPYPVPVPMGGYRGPMVMPHPGAYGVPMAVYRPSGQAAVFRAPAPAAPQVSFSPAPPAAPVTIRAPPPSSKTTSPAAPSSTTPAPPRQSARQSASTPASDSAPAASSAPSPAAALAKEVEKKLFVSETALAPPASAAHGTAAARADEASDLDLAPVSKKGLAHPARPGLATVGKKVMIRANHFLVNVADNNLFHYDVAINPESKSRQTNREVLNELIKLHGKTALGGKLPAYDGRKSLYTAGSLPFESEEFVVTLVDPEKKDKERAEREYKITIRIAGRTDLYHLQQFLRGRQRDMPQETIQVLDVVLRESPSWNYVTVSRSFFSTTFGHRGDIGEGLECWRGYYQSLRPTQMGLSLNIDISATSFFKPVSVIKFVEEYLNMRDTSRPLSDRDRVKIKKALRGVRIETTHQQDQIRRYKITGVTSIPMSQLIFPVDDKGTRKTVVQYFWDKYNYSLKHGSWPCLQAGSDSRPVYLPMEVCKILEGQRYSKKLNDRQVTNILRATCKRPQEREQSIHDMVLHNKYADDRFAQEFGIKVSSDLVTVPARVLPPPLLKYHESGREKTCAPSVGQWNMINKKMINGGTIDNWTCLNFSRMRPDEVQRFCMDLIHMCNATGMVVNPRPFVDVKSAAPNHIENALRDVHRRATQMLAQQGVGNQLQLLIVILPDVKSKESVRLTLELYLSVACQSMLAGQTSNIWKMLHSKSMSRLVGATRFLSEPLYAMAYPLCQKSQQSSLVQMSHPPPAGEDSASSIAAVVASMDWSEITKYRGLVSAQPHRQEIIEDLFTVTKDPHKRHNVNNGMIPYAFSCAHKKGSHYLIKRKFGYALSRSKIKRVCETDIGIVSQCCLMKHDCRPNKIFLENISLKNNAKVVASMDWPEITNCTDSDQDWHSSHDETSQECIRVNVILLTTKVEVIVKKYSTVEYVANHAMRGIGAKFTDVYFLCDNRSIDAGTHLGQSCTLECRHRLRGGQISAPKRFSEFLKEEQQKSNWHEIVDIPYDLQRPPEFLDKVVGLGDPSQWAFSMLVEALERTHNAGHSYRGVFSIDDLWYIPDFDCVEIRKKSEKCLDQKNYILDLFVIVSIIEMHFLLVEWDLSYKYPMYLDRLVKWIHDLKETGTEYLSKVQRAVVFLNPAGWSAAKRIQLFDSLMIHYHKLELFNDRQNFRAALGQGSSDSQYSWKYNLSEEMMNCMGTQKIYRDDYFGLLDFTRCFFTHMERIIGSEKQADAAIYLLAKDQIIRLLNLLLIKYQPTTGALPAVGTSSASIAIHHSAGGSVTTRQCSELSRIPRVNTLEVFHYFGFRSNPSS